jgi:hypothetical protein
MHPGFYDGPKLKPADHVAAPRLCWTVLRAVLVGVAVVVTGCAGVTETEAPFTAQTISFNSNDVGKLPPDFTTALTGGGGPISWVVREDSHAPDGRFVLVQESADDTSYRFPLCIYDKVVARDVAVETKFKAISGKVDEAGGVVLRYNPEDYYIARANALEDNIDLFKTVKGKRLKIEEAPMKVSAGEWHTLRFEAFGPRLRIMFDGKLVIEKNDRTFTGPGKVGFWTKADSVSAFSDLKIEPARR